MPAIITPERPDTPDATALIAELEAYLEPLYPRESRHRYSVEKLIAEGVAFFLMRDGCAVVGCGRIKTKVDSVENVLASLTSAAAEECQGRLSSERRFWT